MRREGKVSPKSAGSWRTLILSIKHHGNPLYISDVVDRALGHLGLDVQNDDLRVLIPSAFDEVHKRKNALLQQTCQFTGFLNL